jgi:hypothetical protein
MKLEINLGMYQPIQQVPGVSGRERVFTIVSLESLSAGVLYTGDSGGPASIGGAGSGFLPASSFGLGPGIAREMSEAEDMIERARKDDDSPSHLNYEYLVPGRKTASGKQKYITLANIHIDLED